MKTLAPFLLSALIGPFANTAIAQPTATDAIRIVRDLIDTHDYEGARQAGDSLVAGFPDNPELRAFHILARARNGDHTAVDAAQAFIDAHPDEAWAHFAMAGALNARDEADERALEASETALRIRPDQAEMQWMRAESLRRQKRTDEAVAFVDSLLASAADPVGLLVSKGLTFWDVGWTRPDAERAKWFADATTVLREAHRRDPANFSASAELSNLLAFQGRHAEAFPIVSRIAQSSPNTNVHRSYWSAIKGSDSLDAERKQELLKEDLDWLVSEYGHRPSALLLVHGMYSDIGMGERDVEIGEEILTRAPESPQAEWVLLGRIRYFRSTYQEAIHIQRDPAVRAEFLAMVRAFLNREFVHRPDLTGEVYMDLFSLVGRDSIADPETIREAVIGMATYEKLNRRNTYVDGVTLLAERTPFYAEAESLARQGMDVMLQEVEQNRERGRYDSPEAYEEAKTYMAATMQGVLGWVYFQAGRLDDAERELLEAYERGPLLTSTAAHLGRLYETRYDLALADPEQATRTLPGEKGNALLDQAEFFYTKATRNRRQRDAMVEALESVYQKRHGSTDGFDEYAAGVDDREAEWRKERILSARIEDSSRVPTFALQTLDGETWSLDRLSGKIAVINFWYTTCGPCVFEMPDFQKLHEHYRDDDDVAILSISTDTDRQDVMSFMEKNGYDFDVLLDDGFAWNAGVFAFPTTWFLDRQGQLTYAPRGSTPSLFQEFSWRIEAMRGE